MDEYCGIIKIRFQKSYALYNFILCSIMPVLGGMVLKENTMSAEERVVRVASTLAIENMYVSENYKQELLLVAQGKKSSKDVLRELDEIYSK